MKLVAVKIPESQVTGLDDLVLMELYRSRGGAIRAAVRDLLYRELWHVTAEPPYGRKR